jgi:pyrimidine-nucleoside phosphorylase
MIHLGGKATTPEAGRQLAEAALADGSALRVFFEMVAAQGGDVSVFDDMGAFHKPGATQVVEAWQGGFVAEMDSTALGWAVQRLGAGREKAGEPVDPHAGIEFHARRGARVEAGRPFATLYATSAQMLAEPVELIRAAVTIQKEPPQPVPLVSRIFTRPTADAYLKDAVR